MYVRPIADDRETLRTGVDCLVLTLTHGTVGELPTDSDIAVALPATPAVVETESVVVEPAVLKLRGTSPHRGRSRLRVRLLRSQPRQA
jgi:hypothetical protein